jgi:hypothetical protein
MHDTVEDDLSLARDRFAFYVASLDSIWLRSRGQILDLYIWQIAFFNINHIDIFLGGLSVLVVLLAIIESSLDLCFRSSQP